MSEPLFDQSFYDYFAEHTQTRLTDAITNIHRYREGLLEYATLADQLRHLFHNIAGEARMLDLPDVGRLILRLGHRLGRLGSVPTPLGPEATQHLSNCCELLVAWVKEEVVRRDLSVITPRQAFMQELLRLEAET